MLLTDSMLRRDRQGAWRAACEGSNDPVALVAIDEAEFCILLVRCRPCRPCASVIALINSPNSEKGSLPSVLFSPLHLQHRNESTQSQCTVSTIKANSTQN
jgi:hypothetical protein